MKILSAITICCGAPQTLAYDVIDEWIRVSHVGTSKETPYRQDSAWFTPGEHECSQAAVREVRQNDACHYGLILGDHDRSQSSHNVQMAAVLQTLKLLLQRVLQALLLCHSSPDGSGTSFVGLWLAGNRCSARCGCSGNITGSMLKRRKR